jgi:hypothetical protein
MGPCVACIGTGAFLVQACRYLAERLVEAWENAEKDHPGEVLITPDGTFSKGSPAERLVPTDASERIAIARRSVADRCLYGVDINPMAVEMAKLSLWLITVDRDRPFTFLDHAFKCGDSLLGITSLEQLENFSLQPGGSKQQGFATLDLRRHTDEATKKREVLEAIPSNIPEQIAAKVTLHTAAEEAVANLCAAADILVALELKGLKGRRYDVEREASANHVIAHWDMGITDLQRYSREELAGRQCMHWPIAFPEVFAKGGFDAIIGNPPFKAGAALGTLFGDKWRDLVVQDIGKDTKTRRGQYDLCVFFYLQACRLIRRRGIVSGIATNSFPQGDSRIIGLARMYEEGFRVFRAINDHPWPGTAAIHVCLLWITSKWQGERWLDGTRVAVISDALSPQAADGQGQPFVLKNNKGLAFRGAMPYGEGFFIQPEEAENL